MKTQFKILAFFVCLNLATGMAIALALPGTEYVQPTNPSNATAYEEHFNATDTAARYEKERGIVETFVGFISSGLSLLMRDIQYLLDGFPMFLQWISDTYITDASARTSFTIITNALRAMYAILMSIFVIEFISGRHVMD